MRGSTKGGALALLCTAMTISACGSSGTSKPSAATSSASPKDGAAIIAAAFTKTSAAKTARMALTLQISSGTASSTSGLNERGTGSGVIDFEHKLAEVTLNEPTGQSIEERLIGNDAYVKVPPQLAGLQPRLHGKTWLHEKLPSGYSTSLGFGSGGSDASDPTSVLRLVSAVSSSVAKVGSETVRGTATTHYRAEVDFGKAAAKRGIPAAEIAALEKALGTNTFPVDLWIDGQGAARRLQFHSPLPKTSATSAAGQSGEITESLDLFDFGVPVVVKAPPAGRIADLGALKPLPRATPSGVHTG